MGIDGDFTTTWNNFGSAFEDQWYQVNIGYPMAVAKVIFIGKSSLIRLCCVYVYREEGKLTLFSVVSHVKHIPGAGNFGCFYSSLYHTTY